MYRPRLYREDRTDVLWDFIDARGFASLVTLGEGGLHASHLPLLLERDAGPMGTLAGHMARPNPQWRDIPGTVEALAIFEGCDHYISPGWYPSKARDGRVVPTWNYMAVHAYGRLERVDDPAALHAHVAALSDRHEAGRGQPWSVDDAPDDYVAAQLRGIVGFRMTITRLEGAWKLGQNRRPEDRAGAIEGLKADGGEAARTVAQRMSDTD